MHAGSRRTPRRAGMLLSLLLVFHPTTTRAEVLPVRNYTAADGLPRDLVTLVRQDSRGLIWMAAGDGLSRFDGYKFTNYTTDDGLPDRRVNDLLETRAGVYWIATEAGLARFNPTGDRSPVADFGSRDENDEGRTPSSAAPHPGEPMFAVYNPPNGEEATAFNALLEDETGAVWCATSAGLYRLEVPADGKAQFHLVSLGAPEDSERGKSVTVLLKDRRGSLWAGTLGGTLFRLMPDGGVERYAGEHGLPAPGLASGAVNMLFEDRDGRLWAGTRGTGLHKIVAEPAPARPLVERTYLQKDGLPSAWIHSMRQTRDGKLWVATTRGLCSAAPAGGAGALSFQIHNAQNGLCDSDVYDVIEDRGGNLWVASKCNAMRIARNGLTGYGTADGLAAAQVNSIFEDRGGALNVIVRDESMNSRRVINRFDGARFTAVVPNLPARITYHGWGWWQTIMQDRAGEWWVPTGLDALFRFPRAARLEQLASARPAAVYTKRDGLPGVEVFRVYEDARGDVWMGSTGGRAGLVRWERATDSIHDHTAETGAPPAANFTGFAEDSRGNLWIGTGEGGSLLRYRDGKFKRLTTEDGVPPGWIIWLYVDRGGRLWLGSQLSGLNRLDDPGADAPRFVRFTTRDGLSSNNVRSITEDLWGRIYVGTGHGVDRLDPETGHVKHYTAADGLPRGIIENAYRDRHGALWFGSLFGLSRFVPEQKESSGPPPVYITGLRVAGVARRVSELGETDLPHLALASDQNQVSVDFVGLGASLGEELRYQHHLEGAAGGWSAPTSERTIIYANLSPGTYRFAVRAVNADGDVSPAPATFSFTILAPVWQRAWFVALLALAAGLAAYALYRYRVARLLEVANMRTRIATDLHDDIGADLTKIALLSEVARRQLGDGADRPDSPLPSIARISREAVATMSDIVWAINPRRDSLPDLVSRMRRHAEEVFTLRGIGLSFKAPEDGQRLRLDVDVRRDLFLIFKEAVNNAARHSRCSRVEIEFRAEGSGLCLRVSDDGVGFDPSAGSEGHGLLSMRRRAEGLGGRLEVESSAGGGATVGLRLRRARPRRRWRRPE